MIGNTFIGNPVGVTGGDNMLLLNNMVYGSSQVGAKRLATSSYASHNDFFDNAADVVNVNLDATSMTSDPRMQPDYTLESGSPCIDAGAISIAWNGMRVSAGDYLGMAPDLGARESAGGLTVSAPPPAAPAGMALAAVRPNPASGAVAISFTLAERGPARIELMDLAGRRVLVRELGALDRGIHVVRLPEARGLATGVYRVRLVQGGRSVSTPMIVAR